MQLQQNQARETDRIDKRQRSTAIGVALCFAALSFAPAYAGYPAVFWQSTTTGISPKMCMSTLGSSMKQAGFTKVEVDRGEVRGTTNDERAFATCVALPKAGTCGGDGSTVMFVVSGSVSADNAKALLGRMVKAYGHPRLIDCG